MFESSKGPCTQQLSTRDLVLVIVVQLLGKYMVYGYWVLGPFGVWVQVLWSRFPAV